MEHKEQDALEKLGYRKEKRSLPIVRCYVKNDCTIYFVNYVNGNTQIYKTQNDFHIAFNAYELLACAEVIKEMENTK